MQSETEGGTPLGEQGRGYLRTLGGLIFIVMGNVSHIFFMCFHPLCILVELGSQDSRVNGTEYTHMPTRHTYTYPNPLSYGVLLTIVTIIIYVRCRGPGHDLASVVKPSRIAVGILPPQGTRSNKRTNSLLLRFGVSPVQGPGPSVSILHRVGLKTDYGLG